jgi:hypothetical protein
LNTETLEPQEIDVRLAPGSLALNANEHLLALAEGHSDSVSVVNLKLYARTQTRISTWPGKGIGSRPILAASAPDGRLVVCVKFCKRTEQANDILIQKSLSSFPWS